MRQKYPTNKESIATGDEVRSKDESIPLEEPEDYGLEHE